LSPGQTGQDRKSGTNVLGARHRHGGWDKDTPPYIKKGCPVPTHCHDAEAVDNVGRIGYSVGHDQQGKDLAMFVISSDIPPPKTRNKTSNYNYHELQIGESIFLPDGTYGKNKAFEAAKKYFYRHNKNIVSRKEGQGIRLWRIA
jgi:hypothetical protein